jgi:RNA polymerase sigma factor (TIGR02999 family)
MESGDITGLLQQAAHGNKEAFDRLLPLVYDELRRVAHGRLRFEREGHTLNTTAVVHETYLKLIGETRVEWQGRGHFFAVASEAMRRILVDYARRRRTAKRGGDASHVTLSTLDELVAPEDLFTDDQAAELIALDDALVRLAQFNPEGARIVQYRFFSGLSTEEIAELLGSSERSIRRTWTMARAWLRRELDDTIAGTSTLLNTDPGAPA